MTPNGKNLEEKNQKVSFIRVNQIEYLDNWGGGGLILYEYFFNDPKKVFCPLKQTLTSVFALETVSSLLH